MITRLRSRFPATCSRSGGVEGEYILSREALSAEALQRSRSRELPRGEERAAMGEEVSRTKKENRSQRNAFTIELRGGSMRARTHLGAACTGNDLVRRTAVLYGGAVSGRHNPNSKPVPASWVNNNILLYPALPSRDPSNPALTKCTRHFHR